MKMNLFQAIAKYGLLIPCLWVAILEGSLCPLLIFPFVLQQKRNQSLLSAQVTEQVEQVTEMETQMVNRDRTQQSLVHQMKKQTTVTDKQQHDIQTQQTRQKLMQSKMDKFTHQHRQLEQKVNSLEQIVQPTPSNVVPIQRQTLLAIDSANFDHAAKTLGIQIDYEGLKRYINRRFGSLEARIYVGEDAKNLNQRGWFNYLRQHGYLIKTKPVIWHGNTPKANVDVDLAVDILCDGVQFKKVVLCSGDGDYLAAVKKLQDRGIQVIVLNLPSQTSHRLRKVADEYISLKDIMGEISDRKQA